MLFGFFGLLRKRKRCRFRYYNIIWRGIYEEMFLERGVNIGCVGEVIIWCYLRGRVNIGLLIILLFVIIYEYVG